MSKAYSWTHEEYCGEDVFFEVAPHHPTINAALAEARESHGPDGPECGPGINYDIVEVDMAGLVLDEDGSVLVACTRIRAITITAAHVA